MHKPLSSSESSAETVELATLPITSNSLLPKLGGFSSDDKPTQKTDTSDKSTTTTRKVSETTCVPDVGQYEYKDFEEVQTWIDRLVGKYGYQLGASFEYYKALRDHYVREGNPQYGESMVNIIKNDIGVRRLKNDCPVYFSKVYEGRSMMFYQGKFIGWGDEGVWKPTMRGVIGWRVGSEW
jgi:hypothetical protein